jgi:hypothetical protein
VRDALEQRRTLDDLRGALKEHSTRRETT